MTKTWQQHEHRAVQERMALDNMCLLNNDSICKAAALVTMLQSFTNNHM